MLFPCCKDNQSSQAKYNFVSEIFSSKFLCFLAYCLTVTLIAQIWIHQPHIGYYIINGTDDTQEHPEQVSNNDGVTPLLLHYVWIENRQNRFLRDLSALQYLSVLSAVKSLSPLTIMIHTNAKFEGPLWNAISQYVKLVPISKSKTINGKQLMHIEHEADIVKLEAAYKFGGLFADFDIYFIGHRDEFLKIIDTHECIFTPFYHNGRTFFSIGNFGCKAKSEFIWEILEEYKNNFRGYKCFAPNDPIPYFYNGCLFPYLLYTRNKELQKRIHIDTRLLRTIKKRDDFLHTNGRIEWKNRFNVHSGYEGPELTLSEIYSWNSTFGDVLRETLQFWVLSTKTNATTNSCSATESGQRQLILSYRLNRNPGLKLFNDLTTLEYLAILSAVKNVRLGCVVVHSFTELCGPFWVDLKNQAGNSGVQLTNLVNVLCSSESLNEEHISSVANINFKSYFIREPNLSKRAGATHQPVFFTDEELLQLDHQTMRRNRLVNWKKYAVVHVEHSGKDIPLGAIRSSENTFSQLLRLVYFNVSRPLKDILEYEYPCN